MERSGIPGVNADAVKYVQRALLPDHSDAEATAVFTKYVRVFCSYVIVHAVGCFCSQNDRAVPDSSRLT